METKATHQAPGGTIFERYLERKKIQSTDDQCLEAGVLISELKTVDTDKAYSALSAKINRQTKMQVIWMRFSRIAAILILPLLIYTVWSQLGHWLERDQLSYQEISSPSGVRSKVTLPDGTKVWLNAESTIQYSIPFERKTREVKLIGEAFFDVTKNPESPLEVKFNQLIVRVLGTQFNVKAFTDDQQVEVVLKEGSILLENDRKGSKRQVYLKPDQQWVFDKTSRTAVLKEVDADEHIAWHQNRLFLNQTSMADLAKQLERWYNIKVEIKDQELYKYKFTTVFDNEPLYRVIELLAMSSPIDFRYIPGEQNKETGEAEKSILEIRNK
ncbi:FecR family protein [Gaoshiqia sediminis]|uniref:FecR domain-containing protein n=1 Tax=Gaoshiqia sediminis TaxID=2986998 RepID=A0AA41YEP5_9BACT|nr:FecR domain-containing protein [Gaoshiqia sediminis]MCW0484557.1 FecR domain-containing protein [Gaoshiqia sediminis]